MDTIWIDITNDSDLLFISLKKHHHDPFQDVDNIHCIHPFQFTATDIHKQTQQPLRQCTMLMLPNGENSGCLPPNRHFKIAGVTCFRHLYLYMKPRHSTAPKWSFSLILKLIILESTTAYVENILSRVFLH